MAYLLFHLFYLSFPPAGTRGKGWHFGIGAVGVMGGQRAVPGVLGWRSEVSQGRGRFYSAGVHVLRCPHVQPQGDLSSMLMFIPSSSVGVVSRSSWGTVKHVSRVLLVGRGGFMSWCPNRPDPVAVLLIPEVGPVWRNKRAHGKRPRQRECIVILLPTYPKSPLTSAWVLFFSQYFFVYVARMSYVGGASVFC